MLKTRQLGISIVEIAITLAVLALLTAVAVPSTADWIRASRLRSVTESLQSGLQKARSEAVQRNKVVTFWLVTAPVGDAEPDDSCKLSAASASWVISLDNPEDQCASAPSATDAPRIIDTGGATGAAAGASISARTLAGAPAQSVSFDALGQVRGAGGLSRIDLSHPDLPDRQLSIEVAAHGSVRLCDRRVDRASDDPRACLQP